MRKPKVIVIMGQTSSGKSNLAVKIAKKIKGLNQSKGLVARTSRSEVLGEIISADSRQVYKGLDLGTGKITKKEMQRVPHYLLNVANPKKKFTVVEYKKLVDKKNKEIISRRKVPIVCGGTGFYIDAVVSGKIFPEVAPNLNLRKILEKKSSIELFKMLQKLNSNRAKEIKKKNEINNKVRLIRAIEIVKALGKIPKIIQDSPPYEFIKIGLYAPSDILKERINERLLVRIRKGMIKEIENLHKEGLSWRRMNELGLEYRYSALYLQGKITKAEMIKKLNSEIYHYSKRQMTWFKRDPEIKWFDTSKKNFEKEIFSKLAKDFS